ncbi:unnamed protein product [Lactuca saligna]|uniref:Uncharacterized protein n=1 Tax=Lactuca saligna TaxID=75948 RepID=A0AA36EGU2_LACSI|nr:unnamed protein product [Lactuca saligna]
MDDVNYDSIFGISDQAVDAERNATDNQTSENSKHHNDPISNLNLNPNEKADDPVEGEHLDSNSFVEGEHYSARYNMSTNVNIEEEPFLEEEPINEPEKNIETESIIEGEPILKNDENHEEENFDDANDSISIIGSETDQEEKKKSKKSKKIEGESLEKGVKAEQKNQELIVTSRTVEEVSPVLTSVADTLVIEASPSKEMIPSKMGVFRRIKIKRKSQLVKKTQVTSTTDSPTFQFIMDQPFTTIFSTQSTDPPNPSLPVAETMAVDEETDNEGFGGTFETLSFDKAEEDFPDHMLMMMK